MTKKRNLTTFMIAIMIMLFSLPVNAEGIKGYVQWDESSKTLTFKGGESVPSGAFALNTEGNAPGWSGKSSCTKVVFDDSFKDVRPTSCYRWFYAFTQLTTIEGIENLNTEEVTNMSYMFNSCKVLKNFDLSSFNTAKVTNMTGMFNCCYRLTSLDLSSFNTAKVTNMSGMFSSCSGLTSLDLSSFNTAKVENMSGMFGGCSRLTTIYVSDDFATGKVSSSENMFYNCTSLKKGDVSYSEDKIDHNMANCTSGYFTKSNLTPYVKWNAATKVLTFKVAHYIEGTAGEWKFNEGAKDPGWSIDVVKNNCTKVVFTPSFKQVTPTSCYSWFYGFSNLTTIQGIENLNTEKVTNMRYMFSDCPNLRSLTLSSFFNTANVTDMSSMFRGCSSLTSLDLSKFNTNKVENMSSMFNGCSDLENLTLSSFNTDKVTDMSAMFSSCQKLTSLDLSNFDTSNVTTMYQLFYDCSGLTSLDLLKFNTANVTNMNNMFYGCGGLTALDLSSFNTANVTDMSAMFCWCSRLTSLALSSFNTANVEYMSYMFNGCSGLNSLNLSSFNTAKVENMSYMFNGCSGLTKIYVSDAFTTNKVSESNDMFSSCSNLKGATSYDSGKTDKNMANFDGYFTPKIITPYVKWDASTKVLTFKVANTKEEGVYDLNQGANDPGWSTADVYNNCTKVVFTSSFNHAKPTSCYHWFKDFNYLTTIEGIENLNTEEVKNMSYMFSGCSRLTSLDVSSFNTAEVTDMRYMFNGCSGLTSLDVSKFNTDKVTDMSFMFYNCSGLTSLDVSKFNTAEVTDMSFMFYNCKGLTSLDVSKFNTVEVTDMSGMFGGCSGLTSLDVSKFNTAEVTDMHYMFYNCKGLTSLDVSKFNTAEVENMSCMFSNCSGLSSLDVSKFNTAKVTDMNSMFNSCEKLTSLDLSSFNTAEVTNMSNMFVGCSGLTSLDLSSFNTAKVEDMSYMFGGCSGLTTIYVSDDFATGKVGSSGNMFYDCTNLKGAASYSEDKTGIDMANFDGYFTPKIITPYVKWDANTKVLTFKVANNKEEGSGVYDLNEGDTPPGWLGLEVTDYCTNVVFTPSFKQARPTSCYWWFNGFSNLTTIRGIENLNTENVTDMSDMFNGCSGLTSLDLSSFNTAKVENMSYMFGGCSGLTTIYVSDDFTIGKVSGSDNMFEGCNQLEGATSYNSGKTDKNMANFDGYFTPKNITPYVKWDASTNVLTFKVANNKEDGSGVYDLNKGANDPGWNIYDVKNYCTKVVFTPSFNHARPTSCYRWFSGFSKLTTIEGIENLNTEDVTNMSYIFNSCSGLENLDLSLFNTAEVTDMTCMFKSCSGLTSLDLSKFNTAEVTDMSLMFFDCSALTSLDLSSFNTAKVTNMNGMFNSCSGLTSLNFSSFNTANVTTMSEMFYNCQKLTSLNLSNFNTAKVESMDIMFRDCSGLTSLNLSSFTTTNVTTMGSMFEGCKKLTSLNLSNFNTAKVERMDKMFRDCSGLTSLDLSSFNTANVTTMSDMFMDCSGLTSLDLSSFNTANVTTMSDMFNGCEGLTTIYVSDGFTTSAGTSGSSMFNNCSQLVGAAQYFQSKTDKSMANYKTGYFKTYFTLGENKVELCGNPLTTNSLNLTGDNDFVAHAPFTVNTAKYSRDLSTSESTWFSLCLPFAYTPQNFTAYQLKGATANAVEIEEITGTIAAGTPVLFKFKDDVVDVDKIINISATGAEIVKAPVEGATVNGPDGSSLQLCGTYKTKTFSTEDGNAFILLNDKLMNPAKMLNNDNVTTVGVKPFRAYMTLTASAESSAQTSSARAFSIGRGGEGNEGTSAIDLLNSVATDDAEYYDINGRRIDAPVKGVNIVRRGNKTMKLIIK